MNRTTRMSDVRLATVLCMEKVCGRREIPPDQRRKLLSLQFKLQRQLCHELRIPEASGCLSQVPDNTALSMEAREILAKLAAVLATV